MSQGKFQHEAQRWLETATQDLRAAQTLRADHLYAQACFMAQQCGEKAVKAMWYAIGHAPAGQSIQKLVMQYPEPHAIPDMDLWCRNAAVLDRFYNSTRYPNELAELTPGQSYLARDADEAIEYAGAFLQAAHAIGEGRSVQPMPSLERIAHVPASLQPESNDAKPSLPSSVSQTEFTPRPPSAFANVSAESDRHNDYHKHPSTRRRLSHFLAKHGNWIVVIVMIILAIILGIVIPRIPIRPPRGSGSIVMEMTSIFFLGLAAI